MGIFTISPLSAQAEIFVKIREIRGQNPSAQAENMPFVGAFSPT